jgi:hypothetical protein
MNTPALHELMRSYLHQDYDLVGTVADNVDLFLADHPELAAELPDEIDAVLSATPEERDLERLVDELGTEVRPPPSQSYRDWLTQIAHRVRGS